MRREHLVDAEIVVLARVPLHHVRQVDRRPLRRRAALVHPAHPLRGQLLRRLDPHIHTRQRLAVHPDQLRDPIQIHPRRKRLHHLFAARRLQAEERLAAVHALLQNVQPEILPARDVVDAQPLHHARARLEKLHRRVARVRRQLLRQLQQPLMQIAIHLRERLRRLDEIGVPQPPHLQRHLPRQTQIAPALLRVDLLQRGRAALEVDPRIHPRRVRHNPAELQERRAIAALQLSQHRRRHPQTGAGQLIRVARQRVDQLDQQPHLTQRQMRQHLRADIEVLRRKRARLPCPLVERLPLRRPVRRLRHRQVRQHLRTRAEQRPGQRRRRIHQPHAHIAPLAHPLVGHLLQHRPAAPEILRGRLPRAQRVPRHLQPRLNPAGELVRLQHRLHRFNGGLKLLAQRRRKGAQRLSRRLQRRLGS